MTSEEEELAYISDYVVAILRSPTWVSPISKFVDDNCGIFEDVEENKLEYTLVHNAFKQLVDDLLVAHLCEMSLSTEQFMRFCERGLSGNNELHRSLVEQLIRADMTVEASEVTRGMLARDTHPLPKIFRFLLNKLATLGSVEEILAIGHFLPTKIKKDVSFDNRLCNAYLSAGRGSEFLEVLVQDLALAARSGDTEELAAVKDRFPRGGAMGLLDSHPELLELTAFQTTQRQSTGWSLVESLEVGQHLHKRCPRDKSTLPSHRCSSALYPDPST